MHTGLNARRSSALNWRTPKDWERVLHGCGVRPIKSAAWAPVFADLVRGEVLSGGELELDDFLGQILHESGMLTSTIENLNYSAERLMAVWPNRFRNIQIASEFAHRPEAIANRVYGKRMGNVDEGDGFAFRGRGLIMVTGRDGYARLGELMGQDLIHMPHLLEGPYFALEAAIHWWEKNVEDAMLGDTVKVTRRVNGGEIGIAHRIELTRAATTALT